MAQTQTALSFASLEQRPLRQHAVQWLLIAQALAVAPHLLHLPAWVSITAIATLAWRYWLTVTQRSLPPRLVLFALALAGAVGVFAQFGTLFGRDAGVAMLLIMFGLKALETRTLRDAMLSTFLGYFVLISVFFFTQEIPVALFMLPVLIAITAALIGLAEGGVEVPVKEKLRTAGTLLLQSVPMMVAIPPTLSRVRRWRALPNSSTE